MPNQVLRRKGTEAAHQSFTGGSNELTIVSDNLFIALHNSSQVGGFIVPKLTANKRTLDANGILYANSTTTLTTSTAFTWDGTTLTVDGNLTFTGAQTIQTSTGILTVTGTSGLTLTSGTNNTILTQNSVNVFTSEGAGAIANTLYLKAGQAGFGTTLPGQILSLNTTSGGISSPVIEFKVSDTAQGYIGMAATANHIITGAAINDITVRANTGGNILFSTDSGTTAQVYLKTGGSVGIGTTAPSTLLHVGLAGTTLGTIGIAGNTSGLVTLTVAAVAGTWTMKLPTGVAGTAGFQLTDAAGDGITSWASAASTKNAKSIINKFENTKSALNKILSASVYTFKYKEGMGTGDLNTEYVGIMAEDSPWAMHFNNKILNPVNTFGYTVLAIQELNKEIADSNKQIEKLQKEIDKLKSAQK